MNIGIGRTTLADDDDVRVAVQSFGEFESVRREEIVAVAPTDDLSLGVLEPDVPCNWTTGNVPPEQSHARVVDHAQRWLTAVIDDDHLDMADRLVQHRAHGTVEARLVVAAGNDDRELHGVESCRR